MQPLRDAVLVRLRAVLDPIGPGLEASQQTLLEQRLEEAALDLLDLFQQSLDRFQSEVQRQRRLLDALLQPTVRLDRDKDQEWTGKRVYGPQGVSDL